MLFLRSLFLTTACMSMFIWLAHVLYSLGCWLVFWLFHSRLFTIDAIDVGLNPLFDSKLFPVLERHNGTRPDGDTQLGSIPRQVLIIGGAVIGGLIVAITITIMVTVIRHAYVHTDTCIVCTAHTRARTHTRAHTHARTYAHTHARAHTHAHMRTHARIHARAHTHAHTQ
jgi:hypothetical protein